MFLFILHRQNICGNSDNLILVFPPRLKIRKSLWNSDFKGNLPSKTIWKHFWQVSQRVFYSHSTFKKQFLKILGTLNKVENLKASKLNSIKPFFLYYKLKRTKLFLTLSLLLYYCIIFGTFYSRNYCLIRKFLLYLQKSWYLWFLELLEREITTFLIQTYFFFLSFQIIIGSQSEDSSTFYSFFDRCRKKVIIDVIMSWTKKNREKITINKFAKKSNAFHVKNVQVVTWHLAIRNS